jgi:phosphate acetyltransferase
MKTKTLYIISKEPSAGKLVIVMGMMELLKRRLGRVALFRPIIHTDGMRDGDIDFILTHFGLQQSYEDAYGLTTDEMEKLFAQDKQHQFFEKLIEKYKKLEEKYDFVLCEGIYSNFITSMIDFDINLAIAKNFASPVISVLSGQNRSRTDIEEDIRIWNGIIGEDIQHFAIFLNRLSEDVQNSLEKKPLTLSEKLPIFMLPEIKELDRPTFRDVMRDLDANLLFGDIKQTNSIVWQSKVAAMNLEHFLEHLEEGDLVIVPGDRHDILLGTLSANYAKNYPSIAGIILSGGLRPADSVLHLLDGLKQMLMLPFIAVEADTMTTALRVESVKARIGSHSKRKIALAMGMFDKYVDTKLIDDRILTTQTTVLTPAMFEYMLFAKARKDRKHIVLPESGDERILRAAEILLRRGVADITLLGDEDTIRLRGRTLGIDLRDAKIIDPHHSVKRKLYASLYYEARKHKGVTMDYAFDLISNETYFATMMVYANDADGMVSGATHTTRDTIKPALETIKTKAGISIISSVFFMCLDTKVLVYGDCAVNPNPTPEELAQIAISSADTSMQFGIIPKVAMLSYSSGDSGVGEEVERVRKATMIAKRKRPDLMIEGPIQYDAAIDAEVGKQKMPDSKVAGEATVFIFPDLNTGNNTYKAVQRSAGAIAIGPVLQGLKKPVNDLSRGCSVEDIINTVAITAIQAQQTVDHI